LVAAAGVTIVKSKLVFAIVASIGVTVICPATWADTIYTYTGNTYTGVSGSYTTSISITGNFALTTPLAPSLALPKCCISGRYDKPTTMHSVHQWLLW